MSINKILSKTIEFKNTAHWTRIITPFKLPDGDFIDVYLKKENEGYVLTDFGETKMEIEMRKGKESFPPSANSTLKQFGMEIKEGAEIIWNFSGKPKFSQIITFAAVVSFVIADALCEKKLYRFTPVFNKKISFREYSFSTLSRATDRRVIIPITTEESKKLLALMEVHNSDIFQIEEIPGFDFTTVGDTTILLFHTENL